MISSKSGLAESIYTVELGECCKSRSPPPPRAGLLAAHHCQKYYERSAAFLCSQRLSFASQEAINLALSFHFIIL